jgi:hypothetical protein
MTHQFMYPTVAPASDTAPSTDSGGPAGSVGTHNDTAGGPPSRAPEGAQERPARDAARAAPLRPEGAFRPPPTRSGGADERT